MSVCLCLNPYYFCFSGRILPDMYVISIHNPKCKMYILLSWDRFQCSSITSSQKTAISPYIVVSWTFKVSKIACTIMTRTCYIPVEPRSSSENKTLNTEAVWVFFLSGVPLYFLPIFWLPIARVSMCGLQVDAFIETELRSWNNAGLMISSHVVIGIFSAFCRIHLSSQPKKIKSIEKMTQ